MSHAINIPTPFTDIAELAENFASRVDDERIMLPHHEPVPEGEWVQFVVTLGDGAGALAGVGRCTNAFDNGEDREAEHRFDIVMDSLQLDDMSQVYFERILQVRAAQLGESPPTGEVEVPAEVAEAPIEEPAFEEPPAAAEAAPEWGDDATQAVSFEEMEVAQAEHAEPVEAEAPAADFEEPPAEPAYEEPPAEAIAEVPFEAALEAAPDADFAEADATDFGADPAEAFEAEPVADAAGWSEPPAAVAESETVALESDALEIDEEFAAVQTASAPSLTTPEESAIYQLPEPQAPGALPSPHAVEAVLTRPVLMNSWSPEPALRPDPSPSTGYFALAVGAGLPQPAHPPRPALDPTLVVRPAPRPGEQHHEAYAAPEAAAAPAYEAEAEPYGAAEAYEEAGGYEDAAGEDDDAYEAAEAYAEEPADEYEAADATEVPAEGAYEPAFDEPALDDEEMTMDADMAGLGEEAIHEQETREVDLGDYPEDGGLGTETVQVELPDEDED